MALQEEMEEQGIWLFKYRGTLPYIPLIIGVALFVQLKLHPENFFIEESAYETLYEFICLFITLIGLGIRFYTVGHSAPNTSGRNTKNQVAEVLNTKGSYSLLRHPLYLGNFFMWLGPTLLTGNFWFIVAFCFFYWIYYERIMFAEEQFLRRKFSDTYTEWAKQVPAFIPDFKNFISPEHPMSWKKIIRNEKIGILLVFLIFSGFNILGNFIQHKTEYNYVFIVPCILFLPAYLIIKFLIKKTKLLNE